MRTLPNPRGRAFTLIEMLVTIAIFAILIGMMAPAVQKMREAANQATCRQHLKQLGLALLQYHDSQGSFPSGYLCDVDAKDALHTAPGWGWGALLLPYLDQEPAFDKIDWKQSMAEPEHARVRQLVLRVFICPRDQQTGVYDVLDVNGQFLTRAATTSYAACFGAGSHLADDPAKGNGLFFRNSQVTTRDIKDGACNTLALGERAALFTRTPWAGAIPQGTARITPGAPVLSTLTEEGATQALAQVFARAGYFLNSPHSDPFDFYAPHTGVVFFTFADGSVRALSSATSVATVLRALATRAGGESVNAADYRGMAPADGFGPATPMQTAPVHEARSRPHEPWVFGG